jgi:cytochrome c-type biogenesis protein CcmH
LTLWIVIAVMTVLAALYLLRPLAAGTLGAARRGDYDLKVYQSQIDDLDAELARGVISESEARGARNEIERRMLQAVRDAEPEVTESGRSGLYAGLAVAIAVPVAAGLIYLEIGRPELPSMPLADRTDVPSGAARMTASRGNPANDPAQTQQGLDSVENMVASLEARMEEEPESFEGWMLLGRSYGVMDRHGDAAQAYARAASLPEGQTDPAPHMQLGEALIFSAGGIVTERAAESFRRTVGIDPGHPGARYYLALARGQAGDLQGAYDGWLALAKDSPADAPWLPALMERINEAAGDLDIEVPTDLAQAPTGNAPPLPDLPPLAQAGGEGDAPTAPGPTAEQMQDAQSMSADDRQAMIQGMVERLADRLADEPDDYDGWMRLGRAYGVTGNSAGAADAYGNAVRLRPSDVQTRLRYAIAVQEAEPEGPMTDASVQAFTEVAKLDPANPDALFMLGRADAEAGRADAALDRWTRLLTILPTGSDAHRSVASQIEQLKSRSQ